MIKHQLVGNGAAFNAEDGEYISHPGSTSGTGSARCHCGWYSEVLETGAARRAAFKAHKAEALDAELLGEAEAHQVEEPVEEPVAESTKDVEGASDDDLYVVTAHFSGPAKHFFPAFGRDGGKDYALSFKGVTDVEHDGKEFTLSIYGPQADVIENVARSLETLWSEGYDDFKVWKKTNEKYTSVPRSEKWGRDVRFEMEQNWFRAYCAKAAAELPATV